MSGLVCPRCGETVPMFGTGGGELMAAEMGVPFLGRIPIDGEMVVSGDRGDLNGLLARSDLEINAAYQRILESLVPKLVS
ncbi:MAG: ATP-binding protein, partial [Piscirickettsiaceae bacterium CG07_land_8_20_14_0_80_44_28]